MSVFLTYKDPLGSELKELKLFDVEKMIGSELKELKLFDVEKMKCSLKLEDNSVVQAILYSNIKDKTTRATFKSGKVIEVKTISYKDVCRRITREGINRKLAFILHMRLKNEL